MARTKVRKANVLIGRVSRVALDLSLTRGVTQGDFLRPLMTDLSKRVRRDGATGWQLFIVEKDTTETLVGEEYADVDLPDAESARREGQAERQADVPAQLGQ